MAALRRSCLAMQAERERPTERERERGKEKEVVMGGN